MGKAWFVRVALALLAITSVAVAAPRPRGTKPDTKPADPKPVVQAPPPKPPGPDDPAALALLDKIAKGDHKAAVADLAKLAPKVIDGLGTFLARTHDADLEGRRKVLEQIKAQVPDKNGRFTTPERKSAKEEKADDDLDWLASLDKLDPATLGTGSGSAAIPSSALGEVIADDAAIRALASTNDPHAAAVLFDVAFGADTIVYRDEVGRYLRKMEPYCIPALIEQSVAKDYDRKRYATYQLERLDRQEPGKALSSATGDEALTIAILDTFKATHFREAVHAVWTKVDADSPRVRATARDAWMAYITGPAPPPAPKKKLLLPGGKLTKKEKPLWLTYRELADNELRKTSNELLHTDLKIVDPTLDDRDEEHPGRKPKEDKIDLEAVTKQLFDYYDGERAKKDTAQWGAAKALADKGDLAGATAALDRMLAQNPERPDQAAMAAIYFQWGKQLESKEKWSDAAAAYSKAQGLDPKGAHATDALAAHHFALGNALQAQGKDGGPDFRRAVALRPDYAPAKAAADHASSGNRPVWMLYAAGTALAAALGLFAAAMVRRRA